MKAQLKIPASSRLRYRLMDEEDADLLFDLDQDRRVMFFLSGGKRTPREEIDTYFIPRMMDFTDPIKGTGLWAAEDKESGDFLGWTLAREYGFSTDYHTSNIIELGWRFKHHCWGKGFATEAAAALMQVLQQDATVDRFCAIADEENRASTRVMEKLGMVFVDHRIHHTPKEELPVVYYEMPAR